ncbi:MAG: phosphoribosylformylglycinamidine synthase subunit PurS, partial [Candidatus Diapherotrites archaeon]|nr:phosphoribosylformylglycinamidine synthase subunit PurS [Candidatus Diapherotrites archaeon]
METSSNYSFIQVGFRTGSTDALGEKTKKNALEDLSISNIQEIKTVKMYSIDFNLSNKQLEQVASRLLADPVNETYSIDTQTKIPNGFDWMIRVGFKPGVTDNEGKTALLAIKDLLKIEVDEKSKVYTSTLYMLKTNNMAQGEIENIASNLLANQLIQYIRITDLKNWNQKT